MCGIFGIVSTEKPVRRDAVARGTRALERRGPDGEGLWWSPDGRVGLGHRRLAIIDVEGGAQPLFSEDGSVVAVVNGELYGFESQRRALQARGHVFRTGTDSEVLVHLYEELGPAALRELRGELAFLLWDQRRQRLFAGRDRFGVKPLAYGVHDGALYLASSLRALFAAGFPAAWDHTAFHHAASLQYPLPGRTLYRGVSQLLPGHYLLSEQGRVHLHGYWDMDYPVDEPPEDRESTKAFLAHLADAVSARLRADVPVAFQLSGGIDSSAVLALATRELGPGLPCFTVGFDDPAYDESAIAASVAAHLGARHHVVRVSARDMASTFREAVIAGEGLAINGHIAAKFLLSRAIQAAGYKVVLTGEGADEVLCGYAHLRQDLAIDGALLARTNQASVGLMLPHGPSLSLQAVARRLGFVPTWLAAKGTLGHRVHGVLDDAWLAVPRPDPFAELMELCSVEGQLLGRPAPLQASYLWSKLALEGYILRTLGDGMEMAHSLEGRLPFLDHELFAWLRAAPLSQKIRQGTEKFVLREAMRGLLPEALVTREKHPFLAPPHLGAGAEGTRELLLDTLASRSAASLPFFDRAKLRALAEDADRAPELRSTVDPVLFLALSAYTLHEHFSLEEGS